MLSSYQAPFGIIDIHCVDQKVWRLSFRSKSFFESAVPQLIHPLLSDQVTIDEVKQQLDEYFSGRRKKFNLPLYNPNFFTPFQKSVWQELQNIPYGETISYAELAKRIGRPKAFRAVGSANRCNLIPIVIPCHRVIGTNGKSHGYNGGFEGIEIQEYLLQLESRDKNVV